MSRILLVGALDARAHGEVRRGKITTHIQPLADAVDDVTYIGQSTAVTGTDSIEYRPVSPSRWFPLRLLVQCLTTIRLARTGEYRAVASFSLVPYGLFALIAGRLSGRPTHLGIIGMDLDVHATAWYGSLVRWLFRRFDAITVAGEAYRRRLVSMGVPPSRIYLVSHPVDESYRAHKRTDDPRFDLLWVGRMSREKDPLRFISIVETLRDRGTVCQAAMVGDGPLLDAVRTEIDRRDLGELIELAGWTPRPVAYYCDARVYVLTSRREMLPLTVVEALAVGVPVVAPALGGIPEVVEDGRNGRLVSDRHPGAFAEDIETMLADEDAYTSLSMEARRITETHSRAAVASKWEEIIAAFNEIEDWESCL